MSFLLGNEIHETLKNLTNTPQNIIVMWKNVGYYEAMGAEMPDDVTFEFAHVSLKSQHV